MLSTSCLITCAISAFLFFMSTGFNSMLLTNISLGGMCLSIVGLCGCFLFVNSNL